MVQVFIKLFPYRYELHGIDSPHDMMRKVRCQYAGEMNNALSGEDVKGFTKIAAIAGKIHEQSGVISGRNKFDASFIISLTFLPQPFRLLMLI